MTRARRQLRSRPSASPRPRVLGRYLHPVRTLGGFAVTDAHPADHDWHVGIGVAVQDVNGWNLWGGRTYVRGCRTTSGWATTAGSSTSGGTNGHKDMRSRNSPGSTAVVADLLRERRELRWGPAAGRPAHHDGRAWVLELSFTLSIPAAADFDTVKLGSPGSNGREAGGYGGFFWRLPRTDELEIRTPDRVGEAAVHGTVADWLAVSLRSGDDSATILLMPTDPVTAADRWFVRSSGYPGVGSSLAWDKPVEVVRSRPVRRGFRAIIADGQCDPADLVAITKGRGRN